MKSEFPGLELQFFITAADRFRVGNNIPILAEGPHDPHLTDLFQLRSTIKC